ncbi:hypothetical protein ABZ667_42000 [Streptomyces lavendulae]|uniref:hypothetical protein n=1 Tax=Streptomyces lavendulae TaxID=1914 RepID=UPI0033FD367B
MGIDITKTTGATATISWNPQTDDARGYLAQAIESGRLENALSALGTPAVEDLPAAQLRQIAQSTASIQRELERRTRAMVVQLRDRDGLSWADIASILYDDPSKRSTARAAYDAGLRQTGHQPGGPIQADTIHGGIVFDNGVIITGGDTD